MNTKQFVVDLLSSYPEVMRPQDKAYLITIERNISDLALSGEAMRAILKRIVSSEVRFPAWATIKQWADVVCNEQRSMSSHKVSHDEYARWKLESCSLDDALPYMVAQLVDTGEMSRELLGAITGKWQALGITKGRESTYPGVRVGTWAAAGALLGHALPVAHGHGRAAASSAAAAETDPGHSSIAAIDISRGGPPANMPFAQAGPTKQSFVRPDGKPDLEEFSKYAGRKALEMCIEQTMGPTEQSVGLLDVLCEGPADNLSQPLERCGSCGKYFLRSSHCSCIADYDDSESLEDL